MKLYWITPKVVTAMFLVAIFVSLVAEAIWYKPVPYVAQTNTSPVVYPGDILKGHVFNEWHNSQDTLNPAVLAALCNPNTNNIDLKITHMDFSKTLPTDQPCSEPWDPKKLKGFLEQLQWFTKKGSPPYQLLEIFIIILR